ncbi:MAG TPA: histidine phosphatase family protein [Desulfobulbus sp.]|nr:histidine phosphatase family protein [Desulfobulbus sp.]
MSTGTTFGLVRHGRTVWNEERRIQGRLDSPLSPAGREMARRWGRELARFGWHRILASDLGRARATVDLINQGPGLEVHFDPRLREQDWGRWSGLTFAELHALHQEELDRQVAAGWDFRPPGGESRREVLVRARAALTDGHRRWPGEQVLVVCHEGIIKCLLYHLCHRRFLPGEPPLLRKGYWLHLLRVDREIHLEKLHAAPLTAADTP